MGIMQNMTTNEHFTGNADAKAIIVKDGKVLMTRDRGDTDYWDLPGGRLHLSEGIVEALKREIKEELGVEIAVGQFVDSCQVIHTQSQINTLCIAYHAVLADESIALQVPSEEIAEVRWIDQSELANLKMYDNCLHALKAYWRIS
jgi:8-oxo-dGTP diphosphatase